MAGYVWTITRNSRAVLRVTVLALYALGFAAATSPATAQAWDPRVDDSRPSKLVLRSLAALDAFRDADPSLQAYFDEAYGYVIFPSIAKGAIGIGGARGKGILFRGDRAEKRARTSQFTIGVQFGGKKYRQLIFFRDADVYDAFVEGTFQFSAQATATIASDGAGETVSYDEGVAVFVLDKAGALFEASIGGQTFKVKPLR